jgi:RNA polymerase sigma-70 factor (ECF subfamily)
MLEGIRQDKIILTFLIYLIMKKYSDEKLVQLFIAGSSDALDELISRHRKQLLGYLISIVGQKSTADDIFQETFIKVIERLKDGKYVDNGKFASWLFRVAHNAAIDYLRKQQGVAGVVDIDTDSTVQQHVVEDVDIEQFNLVENDKGTLRTLICRLPKEQCEVLTLRYYMDLSFKEVAEHLDIGINTALGRMRYAIVNLQKMIEKENPDMHQRWKNVA